MQKRPIHQTKETYQADSESPIIDHFVMKEFVTRPQNVALEHGSLRNDTFLEA